MRGESETKAGTWMLMLMLLLLVVALQERVQGRHEVQDNEMSGEGEGGE